MQQTYEQIVSKLLPPLQDLWPIPMSRIPHNVANDSVFCINFTGNVRRSLFNLLLFLMLSPGYILLHIYIYIYLDMYMLWVVRRDERMGHSYVWNIIKLYRKWRTSRERRKPDERTEGRLEEHFNHRMVWLLNPWSFSTYTYVCECECECIYIKIHLIAVFKWNPSTLHNDSLAAPKGWALQDISWGCQDPGSRGPDGSEL